MSDEPKYVKGLDYGEGTEDIPLEELQKIIKAAEKGLQEKGYCPGLYVENLKGRIDG